jgi:hypothetical protein
MAADGAAARWTGVTTRMATDREKMSCAARRTGTRWRIQAGCSSRAATGIERTDAPASGRASSAIAADSMVAHRVEARRVRFRDARDVLEDRRPEFRDGRRLVDAINQAIELVERQAFLRSGAAFEPRPLAPDHSVSAPDKSDPPTVARAGSNAAYGRLPHQE